ncbi:hypothetical protein D3C75_834990 [compost metagenome]
MLRAEAGRLERHRLRHPGLPEALPLRDRLRDRPGQAQPPPPDDPSGEGRLLGQRDQGRPGQRPGRLPGVYPQAVHRPLLHRLRAQTAGRAGVDLPAVRHPQRPLAVGYLPAGRAELLPRSVRVPVPARDGRAAVRAGGRQGRRRQAEPAVPHLRSGGQPRDPARLPGAPPAGKRRQHLVRQPHRRPQHLAEGPGGGPGGAGRADGRP